MITTKLYETTNQMILVGEIKELSFETSKSEKNYVKLTFETQKPGTAEVENVQVVFIDSDTTDWQARILNMQMSEGAAVYLVANRVENDRKEIQYYGYILGYYSKTGFDIKLHTEENAPEQRLVVGLINDYSRPNYNEEKKTGSITVSVRKYNSKAPEDQRNYFCNYHLSRKDKDAQEGKTFAEMFRNKSGSLGMFITYGDAYITDKQVDKEHPTHIYYTCIKAGIAPQPDPRAAIAS